MNRNLEPEEVEIYSKTTALHGFAVFIRNIITGNEKMLKNFASHDAAKKYAQSLRQQVNAKKKFIRI